MSTLRPYGDYVRAGDTLVVGLNVEGTVGLVNLAWGAVTSQSEFDQVFAMLFEPMQKHNVLLENLNIARWGANGGPTAVDVAAITDFAHWSDVADAVAQSFQEAGFYTSNQAATITAYVGADITQAEAQRFTDQASRLTTPSNSPLQHFSVAQGLKDEAKAAAGLAPDLGNPFATSGQTWLVLLAAVAALFLMAKLKK